MPFHAITLTFLLITLLIDIAIIDATYATPCYFDADIAFDITPSPISLRRITEVIDIGTDCKYIISFSFTLFQYFDIMIISFRQAIIFMPY